MELIKHEHEFEPYHYELTSGGAMLVSGPGDRWNQTFWRCLCGEVGYEVPV